MSPCQIVSKLADERIYVALEPSFYRVLPEKETKPKDYKATGPNQVWNRDITYLASEVRGMSFRQYLVENIFSRKIVVWEGASLNIIDLSPTVTTFRRPACGKVSERPAFGPALHIVIEQKSILEIEIP